MNNERMIEKIKKLFALAANSSAEGNEAENALRMANKLLEKHSIDKLNLADKDEVSCTFVTAQKKKWVSLVFHSISKLYNCRMFIDHTWDKPKYAIIGTEANRITCVIVIEQLLDQIRKASKGQNVSFRNGAAISLRETAYRIFQERRAETEEILPGTGLVPLDLMESLKAKNEEWLAKNVNLVNMRQCSSKASQEGLDYGKGLNPGARVGGWQMRLA